MSGQTDRQQQGKGKKLEVRLSDEEFVEIDAAAAAERKDRSKYVRSVLKSAAEGTILKVSPKVADVLKAIREITGDPPDKILEELLKGIEIEQIVEDELDEYLKLKNIGRDKFERVLERRRKGAN